jgi:hypothetical protein
MITVESPTLEETCKSLLQRQVSFELNNKIFKQGQLILFYQKNFYLIFIINTSKRDKDKIEIPIPFAIETHSEDNLVYFDYRIKTLSKLAPEVENYLKVYPSAGVKNKYWDNILTITCHE